jgi:Glycosyltransferase family 87
MNDLLRKRWFYYSGGIILLAIILYEAHGKTDFDIFISASRDLFLKKNIYTVRYNEWYHYYYDTFFCLLLYPFTFLPPYISKVFWLILNVFFVYRIWKILLDWLPVSELTRNRKDLFFVLSFVFIFSFLRDNFHLAQMTICILYLTLEGLVLIGKNKFIAGSFLIALGIDIKILPLVIIPYLIYRKEWKPAIYVVGFMILLMFLPAVIIGYDFNNFLLAARWHLINPMNHEHILDTSERSFHSLTTLLTTLLVRDCGDPHALTLKRNIADISIANLNLIINIVRGVFVLFTIYFLRTLPFRKVADKIQRLYEISYICLLIPLIFPHQQFYAFFFIFPASTYLLFYLILTFLNTEPPNTGKYATARKTGLIVFLSISYFLTNSHFILGQFNNFYDHYKTLTYGVLILMILLAFCTPGKIMRITGCQV